ncbi:signal peptidase I [Paenibacillus soyae]|uniref:Signal peptidase I n=1 Tax=Paenibacillus soyae TaxID=2969249 RepID=A0A9X2S8U4_9BACL|nr:signal peptidase I [Paenibacillus soyae]MCR2804456.1 signal peptidase I [Paenibacillus soyae]
MKPHSLLLDWVKTSAAAVVVALLAYHFLFTVSPVQGHSMEPTLTEKEWVFVNKALYHLSHPRNGEVVVLEARADGGGTKELLVKRIVGAPGDRIEISGGRLYRNGRQVDEPYVSGQTEESSYGPVVVAEDSYFVLGDNRKMNASLDSRTIGTVPENRIIGRVDWILWPLRKAGDI